MKEKGSVLTGLVHPDVALMLVADPPDGTPPPGKTHPFILLQPFNKSCNLQVFLDLGYHKRSEILLTKKLDISFNHLRYLNNFPL